MKKNLIFIFVMACILLCLVGCKNKYCADIGCYMKHSAWSTYCVEHRCRNVSCKNKGIGSFGYCKECAEMY